MVVQNQKIGVVVVFKCYGETEFSLRWGNGGKVSGFWACLGGGRRVEIRNFQRQTLNQERGVLIDWGGY